ncbi:MAG TPA: hypothetical protein VD767_02850, partial [Thermomicrobiales bacterium]|nr:hypothetical protein [Thermomicrobiales bacterium]
MTSDTTVRFSREGNTLTLYHPLIAAEWRWNDQGRIDFTRFDHTATGASWLTTEPPEPLFQLGVDGYGGNVHHFGPNRAVSAGEIVDVQVNTVEPRGCTGASITIDLATAPQGAGDEWHPAPLTVTWHVQAHPDHPVIRQWFEVTNTADETLTITRLPVLLATLAGTSAGLTAHSGLDRRQRLREGEGSDWLTWNVLPLGPGVTGSFESGYRRTATWLGLTSAEGGAGLFAGWESNAAGRCEYGDLHGFGDCGIDVWLEPQYRLDPGATLTGPAAFLGAADGDLDELSYRCHRFVEDVIARPMPDDERFPYIAFNSWGYGDRIDDASMRRCF